MQPKIRWSVLLAISGFLVGLGFQLPLPGNDQRGPASDHGQEPSMVFIEPPYEIEDPSVVSASRPQVFNAFFGTANIADYRANVLFDIHTLSRSKLARDTDAYVSVKYTDEKKRDEIERFTYCHNYDYEKQSADMKLRRYALFASGQAFKCYRLDLSELKAGYTLIDAGPFGRILVLQAKQFDPKKGGKISILFALKVAKIGRNDYRSIDLTVTMNRSGAQISGPKGEGFDWLNLKMSEDIFNLPNGVKSFELFRKAKIVREYPGKDFPKIDQLPPK